MQILLFFIESSIAFHLDFCYLFLKQQEIAKWERSRGYMTRNLSMTRAV